MSLSFEVEMGREGTGGDFKISLKPRRCCFILACRDKVPSGADARPAFAGGVAFGRVGWLLPSVSAHTLTPLVPFVPHKDQGWLGAATSYAVRGVWR